MQSTRNRYIAYLVVLNALLITGLLFSWRLIFTDVKPMVWTAAAMAFFLLYEATTIWITDKKNRTITPRRSVNLFMALKTGKIFLSFLFVTIYMFTVNTELKAFVLVFVGLYFIYLLFDTFYLIKTKN